MVSPYLPRALRRVGGPVMSSNAHRASESASKESTIRDDLDEVITISNVTILIGEWIPFGANQVVELNMKLGSNERCQARRRKPFFVTVLSPFCHRFSTEIPPISSHRKRSRCS